VPVSVGVGVGVMRLESGPAAYERNYYAIFLLLCLGLGGYFIYDYTIGYPNKNLEEAQKRLARLPEPPDRLDVDNLPGEPTKPTFDALFQAGPTDPEVVHQQLGPPYHIFREGRRTVEYFASRYGLATVTVIGGRVDPKGMKWTTWYKTKEEIRLQLYCALAACAFGLYVLYRVYRAATLHAVIDAEGLTYGTRRIPFDAMRRLCDYNRKGWVDLYYEVGGQERRLRIDNQKIRKFDEIIDALCEAKGFDDPRPPVEEDEQTEEASPAEDPDKAD
jgi:hypothetical protein